MYVLCCLFYCYPHPEAERKEFDVFWRFGIFWKNAHQSSSLLKKICIYFVFSYGIKFYLKDSINSKYMFSLDNQKSSCVLEYVVHVRKSCPSRNLYHSTMETIMYLARKTMFSFVSWSKQKAKHCLHCTEVRFASFLSDGFITGIVVNPLERKLGKCTFVYWNEKL